MFDFQAIRPSNQQNTVMIKSSSGMAVIPVRVRMVGSSQPNSHRPAAPAAHP